MTGSSRRGALRLRDLSVRYADAWGLQPLSVDVPAGTSVALTGPSGTGKSTLLSCCSGYLAPTTGAVIVDGADVSAMTPADASRFRRRHVGQVFQDPELLPELDVAENVALLALFDGVPRRKALQLAREQLERVGLGDLAGRRVTTLSRGQAQRVALARALARPEVSLVLADEPTASLDAANAEQVVELLVSSAKASGATLVVATHDLKVAAACELRIDLRERSGAAAW